MGRSIALCIGVDKYEDEGISDLNCAERDASKLAYTLESLGFEAEFLSKDVSADQVFRKLRAASRKLESEEDLLVFFFAGHGKTVQQGHGSDQLLLLPSVSSRVLEQGIVHGAPGVLSYRALVAETAHLKGKRLFMFDACRLPILESERAHRDGSLAVKFEGEGVFRGIALSTKQKGVGLGPLTILNSCSDGQRAEELAKYPGGGHGAMTAALLELLKEVPKAGRSLKLNGEYVTGVLKERMGQLIQEYGSGQGEQMEQIPYLQGEEVTLYQPAEKVGPSEDERLWILAESEGTVESYQRYIKEAPEARHAMDASQRVKALKESKGVSPTTPAARVECDADSPENLEADTQALAGTELYTQQNNKLISAKLMNSKHRVRGLRCHHCEYEGEMIQIKFGQIILVIALVVSALLLYLIGGGALLIIIKEYLIEILNGWIGLVVFIIIGLVLINFAEIFLDKCECPSCGLVRTFQRNGSLWTPRSSFMRVKGR